MNRDDIQRAIAQLPVPEQEELLKHLRQLDELEGREKAQQYFLEFIGRMWPDFIAGNHHKIMADAFERIARGECKRLIVTMPPRHTKSMFASVYLPAWYFGRFPNRKIIQCSHNAELATGFGRQVRNIVQETEYQKIFPGVSLSQDSKAAGHWHTNHGGEYFSIGVGGAVTGKGADILVIDDPFSEQEGMRIDGDVYDSVYEWYTSGPRQRLQPGGSILVVMTRWNKRDLVGRVLQAAIEREGVDQWEVIEFPAILPSGEPLWPEFWSKDELLAVKAEIPVGKWSAQYMQEPTSEEGAIIKREWWKIWDEPKPPTCEFIIQSWDTAYTKNERSDFCACTTWGVFYRNNDEGDREANIILLDAFNERMEFPELKSQAFNMYKAWEPDAFIVEAKAAGAPLIFELKRMGIPVMEFTPTRGNDKISRVNAISDLFSSGMIWAPQTRWSEEVIEQFAAFPLGDHDDLVDSSTQALLRFRQGGFIGIPTDEQEEKRPRRTAAFY